MGSLTALWSLLFACFVYAARFELATCELETLYFSFITAHSRQYTALGAVPAVDLALEDINSDPRLLSGYNLSYTSVGNSLCDHTNSLDTFFSRLFNNSQPKYVSMMCCGCSVAAIPVAEISHHWNIPQMAYAAASLTLNNRHRYRSFFRTMPVYTNMGVAVATLAEAFNWTQLAVITQSNGLFLPVLESLQEIAAQSKNLKLDSHVLQSTSPLPFDELFNWGDDNYRIIFINAYRVPSQDVACEAYKQGLFGSRYVWITVNWGADWWIPPPNHDCTEDELVQVLDRGFTIIPRGFFIRNDKDAQTLSGRTPEQFERLYADRINATDYNFYSRYGLTYDATWAIALGLNTTLTRIASNDTSGCEDVPGSIVPLTDFEYSNTLMGCILRQSYHQTSFSGVTGDIMFNSNGSRVNNIVTIRQNRKTNGILEMQVAGVVRVGVENNNTFEYAEGESLATIWSANGGQPPYDGRAMDVVHPVALPLIIIYDTLATIALMFAAVCVVFNIVYRNRKVVKLSSPNLNYLIIIGATLLFLCVYLYNYTVGSLEDTLLQTLVCNLRQWLSAIGYTLCFAVILSKTWRIYYILNNPTKKKKTIRDWVLLVIVGVVVGIDVLIHSIGTAIPQTRLEANLTKDPDHEHATTSEGYNVRRFIFVCANNAIIWLAVSYSYKGLLQLVAMFMAFHTRKIKIRALNDSKEIAAIVYINSIIMLLLALTEFTLKQHHYVYSGLNGMVLLIGGSLFLGLIFIPKMVSVHFDPDGKDLFTVPPPLSEITKQGFSESSQPHSKNKTLQGESVDTKVKDGLAEIKIPGKE